MPVERPTVPKADTTSNNIWTNVYLVSIMLIKNVLKQTSEAAKNVSTNA
jgi:hypothetical protein